MMTDEERTPGITQKHKKKHLSFREKSIILETMLLETNTTLFNITFINDFMFKLANVSVYQEVARTFLSVSVSLKPTTFSASVSS